MKRDVMFIKEAVEEVLKNDTRARNDDKWLILQVLKKLQFPIVEGEDWGVFIPHAMMGSMPSFESITRCRRMFQHEGMYPSLKMITQMRGDEEDEMRNINKWF